MKFLRKFDCRSMSVRNFSFIYSTIYLLTFLKVKINTFSKFYSKSTFFSKCNMIGFFFLKFDSKSIHQKLLQIDACSNSTENLCLPEIILKINVFSKLYSKSILAQNSMFVPKMLLKIDACSMFEIYSFLRVPRHNAKSLN